VHQDDDRPLGALFERAFDEEERPVGVLGARNDDKVGRRLLLGVRPVR